MEENSSTTSAQVPQLNIQKNTQPDVQPNLQPDAYPEEKATKDYKPETDRKAEKNEEGDNSEWPTVSWP